MRRFLLFSVLIVAFLLSSYWHIGLNKLSNVDIIDGGCYSYSDYIGIQCGNLHIISGKTNYILSFGQYAYIRNSFDLKEFVNNNNLDIIATEHIIEQDLTVYLFYSDELPKYRVSNNKKYNLQLAINNNYVKIGYPAIFDSF